MDLQESMRLWIRKENCPTTWGWGGGDEVTEIPSSCGLQPIETIQFAVLLSAIRKAKLVSTVPESLNFVGSRKAMPAPAPTAPSPALYSICLIKCFLKIALNETFQYKEIHVQNGIKCCGAKQKKCSLSSPVWAGRKERSRQWILDCWLKGSRYCCCTGGRRMIV
jgi:hypothetical protein